MGWRPCAKDLCFTIAIECKHVYERMSKNLKKKFWSIDMFKSILFVESGLGSSDLLEYFFYPAIWAAFRQTLSSIAQFQIYHVWKQRRGDSPPPPHCVLICCTPVVLSHLIKSVLFWTRSIEIAHSFGFTRTLLKVYILKYILKCCFLRYRLRSLKFMISFKFPHSLWTRKWVP